MRRATPEDARAVAHVHVQSWRETYGPVLDHDFLAGMDVADRARRWERILREGDSTVLVAQVRAGVVGWTAVSPRSEPDLPPEELSGLYVLASHHGTGAGHALIDAVVGSRDAFLWVWEDNARAIAFYRAHGFRPDGARDEHDTSGGAIPVLRMTRVGWVAQARPRRLSAPRPPA